MHAGSPQLTLICIHYIDYYTFVILGLTITASILLPVTTLIILILIVVIIIKWLKKSNAINII